MVWGGSNVAIGYAFQNTAVATVLVINASNPVFSAIFGYFLLGEVPPIRTICASIVCIGAIALIFAGEVNSGSGNSIGGVLASLASSISMGLYFVLLRLLSIKSSSNE